MKRLTLVLLFSLIATLVAAGVGWAGPKEWDGIVHAPLKTAQPKDWSAPDQFFTGDEGASIWYTHTNDTFEGWLDLAGFKQAGPYVLTAGPNEPSDLQA